MIIIIIRIIIIVIKINNKLKKKKRSRDRMGSWSFRLLSKNIKTFGINFYFFYLLSLYSQS